MNKSFKSFNELSAFLGVNSTTDAQGKTNKRKKSHNNNKPKKKTSLGAIKHHKQVKSQKAAREVLLASIHAQGGKNIMQSTRSKDDPQNSSELNEHNLKASKEARKKYVTLVSQSGTASCTNKNHTLESVQAIFKVITKQGNIKEVSSNATYCCSCDKHIISNWTIEELQQNGILLCRIDNAHTATSIHDTSSPFSKMNEESLIHQWGYNVNQQTGYTDIQRQRLLKYLIDEKIDTRQHIDAHLTWLITHNEGKPNMQNAISKWKADRTFVSKYKLSTLNPVYVKAVIMK